MSSMSNIYGMDIQGVRTLAGQLDTKAGEIEQILSILTSTLSSTQWLGPDATRFRDDWDSTHSANLRRVAEALRTASQNANANAQQQEQASGV